MIAALLQQPRLTDTVEVRDRATIEIKNNDGEQARKQSRTNNGVNETTTARNSKKNKTTTIEETTAVEAETKNNDYKKKKKKEQEPIDRLTDRPIDRSTIDDE